MDKPPCPQCDSRGHYSNQRPQTYPLERTATQIGDIFNIRQYNSYIMLLENFINIYMHAKFYMPN